MKLPTITFREIDSDFIVIDSKPYSYCNDATDLSVKEIVQYVKVAKEAESAEEFLFVLRACILRLIEERLLDPSLDPTELAHILALKEEFENASNIEACINSKIETASDVSAVISSLRKASSTTEFVDILLCNPKIKSDEFSFKSTESSKKDDRDIQFIRDIERDIFRIDGQVLNGSTGFNAILETLSAQLSKLASKHCWWREVPKKAIDAFAKKVLRSANRTESGGQSFDTINSLLKCNPISESEFLLVPASTSAKPLCIDTSVKPYFEDGSSETSANRSGKFHALGMFVHINAVTVYNVYHFMDMDEPLLKLTASYQHLLCMHLLPLFDSALEEDSLDYNLLEPIGKAAVVLRIESPMYDNFT